ncbi:MAG: hypothetical protein P8X65_04600 [Syntrophobacterales bacterium]|jgi:hypothetical protein
MWGSRGRKTKKAKWQIQLGIKELIFTGLGVAGLAMMSFAIGTLAGRGDIYRVLYNWGLLGPDSGRAVQIWRQTPPPPPTPVAARAQRPSEGTPAPQPAPAKPAPSQTRAADPAPKSPPVKGHIVMPPSPSQTKKKSIRQDAKAKENKLEKIRREVASKLKFQNSLDLAATRMSHPAKTSTSQVMVAKFRSAKRARARLTQMRKQGEKVVLKEEKDNEGRYFVIYRQVTVSSSKHRQVTPTRLKKTKLETKSSKSASQ